MLVEFVYLAGRLHTEITDLIQILNGCWLPPIYPSVASRYSHFIKVNFHPWSQQNMRCTLCITYWLWIGRQTAIRKPGGPESVSWIWFALCCQARVWRREPGNRSRNTPPRLAVVWGSRRLRAFKLAEANYQSFQSVAICMGLFGWEAITALV